MASVLSGLSPFTPARSCPFISSFAHTLLVEKLEVQIHLHSVHSGIVHFYQFRHLVIVNIEKTISTPKSLIDKL